MVKGMEMRGTGPLPGLELLVFASFLSSFCFEKEEQLYSRDIWSHPTEVLNSSLPQPGPEQPATASFPQPPFLTRPHLPTLPFGES